MSLVHDFISQPPLALTRELFIIVVIVALATLATLVFAGSVTDAPFAPPQGQLALPF